MRIWKHRGKIAFVASVLVFYSATLVHNLNESQRRSLALKEGPSSGNQVDVSFQVISMDPVTSQMTTRVNLLLSGDIAKDPATPSVDLKFFVNGIMGPQEIDFPHGQRMNPFTAVFAVDGNVNRYPLDTYKSLIRVLVLKSIVSRRPRPAKIQPIPSESTPSNSAPGDSAPTESTPSDPLNGAASDAFVATAALDGEPLPISSSISASIPGFKFDGQRVEHSDTGIEGFNIDIRRADNVIVFSVVLMTLMTSLALSVLLMCLSALASSEKLELLPLSLCVSLLFGLPALRNSQPAVPPLGVLGDYASFIWAEMIVAFSAVMMIWNWMIRRHSDSSDHAEKHR